MKKKHTFVIIIVLLLLISGIFGLNQIRRKTVDSLKRTVDQQAIQTTRKHGSFKSFMVEDEAVMQENSLQDMALSHNPISNDFTVTVLSAKPGRTRFRFELKDFAISDVMENGKTYSAVTIGGAWEMAVKGKPALPVIRRDFVVAKGRKTSLRIIDVQEERISCAQPKPSVGMLPRTAEIPLVEEDVSVYGGDDVYPLSAMAAGERYVIRGAEGMSVSIHPMRYDFHDGMMVVTRSFEAEITEDSAVASDYGMMDDEWNFRQLLNRRFENGSLLRGGEADGTIGTMLFIVPDAWAERLDDFVAWKERLGYDVIVAGYPSMTGEDADSIMAYIQGAYNDSLISHVILCGDRGDIPPYAVSMHPNSPSTFSPTTDVPYSWVDGDDLYADLFISRMAVSTASELSAVCAKIMAYEQSTDEDDWHGRGGFIGSSETGSAGVSNGRTDSSLVEEERQKLLDGNGIDNSETLYATNMTVTVDDVGTVLNEGCSLIYYLGHGYSYQWTTSRFQNTDADALQNGALLPFVASFCCSTANFAYKNKSLGEAFLRNPNGGAVGFLGATSETYWNPPIYAMRRMTDDILKRYSASRLTCQGAYACSAVMAGIDYITTASSSEGGGTSDYFARQMHLLGDCSALGRLGSGRKGQCVISRLDAEHYAVRMVGEDAGEPISGAVVCIRTADGGNRYAVRSDEDGMVTLPSFAGKSYIMVSDAGWGCMETEVNIGIEMDANMDGTLSNAEVRAYLSTLYDSSFTSMDIPSTVTAIGERAFYGCTSLTSITIPATVTSIGEDAFYGCTALSEIIFDGAVPAFGDMEYSRAITFSVPSGMGWEEWQAPENITVVYRPFSLTMNLSAGWNWVGFNVLPDNHKVNDVLGTRGFTANDIIQTYEGMARFNGMSWLPSGFTVEYGKMYQIYSANAVTVEISGNVCDSSSLAVNAGWNWISNLTGSAVTMSDLLHSGGWTAGDRIQSTHGIMTYSGSKWLPSNSFLLESGKGYQLYTANSGTISFGNAEEEEALYIVVDLSGGPNATDYPVRYTNMIPNLDDDKCRTTELWLRRIPAGTFIMGSPDDEIGRDDDETQHEVRLTQNYYIGVFECTQRQWELVMGTRPSYFNNENDYMTRPVEQVSYDEIRGASSMAGAGWPKYGHTVDYDSFMGKLQMKTGLVFDLPTEAQWEYACRAGTVSALNSGQNLSNPTGYDDALNEVGRYWHNGGSGYFQGCSTTYGTAKVGSYLANAWGLYDMHGNIWEWTLDWYNETYDKGVVENPKGASSGTSRVGRGGRWTDGNSRYCRSADRGSDGYASRKYYGNGFRVACLPELKKYAIDVENGMSDMSEAYEGEIVTITANESDSGMVFDKWLSDDVEFANMSSATTTFVMPAKVVTVKARMVAANSVSFWLESDVETVKPGDVITVRLMAKNWTGSGLVGFGCNVNYNAADLAYNGIFNPAEVVNTSVFSFLADGQLTENGIVGLYGVCLNTSIGIDGEPILMATMEFVVQNTAGDNITIDLSNIDGAVSGASVKNGTLNINYEPLTLAVDGGMATIPAFMIEFAGDLQTRSANVVNVGMADGASYAYSVEEGDIRAVNPNGNVYDIRVIDRRRGEDLHTDIRGFANREVWNIQITVATGQRLTLDWSEANLPDYFDFSIVKGKYYFDEETVRMDENTSMTFTEGQTFIRIVAEKKNP